MSRTTSTPNTGATHPGRAQRAGENLISNQVRNMRHERSEALRGASHLDEILLAGSKLIFLSHADI